MKTLILIMAGLVLSSFLVTVLSAAKETAINEKAKYIPTLITEIKDDLILVLRVIFVHKFSIRTLKHLEQIGLYFMEIFTVCGLFLILENILYPIASEHFYYDLFTRFLGVFTAYQIFVYSVMNLINSALYDEWLALVRIIKLQQLYNSTETEFTKEELDKRFNESLDAYSFMTGKPKEYVQEIKNGVTPEYLDYLLIVAQHNVERLSSYWHFSFLLNAIK